MTWIQQMNPEPSLLVDLHNNCKLHKEPAKRNTIYLYGFKFKWGHVLIVPSCMASPTWKTWFLVLMLMLECFILNKHKFGLVGEVGFWFNNEQPSRVVIILTLKVNWNPLIIRFCWQYWQIITRTIKFVLCHVSRNLEMDSI